MNRITNTCISATLLVFSVSLNADDHGSNSPLFYGQSFGFAAEDAGAVVAAMEKWRNSHSFWGRCARFSLTPCMTNESPNVSSF